MDWKYVRTILSMVLATSFGYTQGEIEVWWDQDKSRNEYVLHAMNHTYSRYTLDIGFDLTNMRSTIGPNSRLILHPGRQRLCSIKPIEETRYHTFNYRHKYYQGCYNARPDTKIIYTLPTPSAQETKSLHLTYLGSKYGLENPPKDWFAIAFTLEEGDTVFFSRKGKVVEVVNYLPEPDSRGLLYADQRNYVLVEHRDCTYGRYEVLAQNQVFVQPGDEILPGDPIGLAAGINYEAGYHIRFSTYYSYQATIKRDDGEIIEKHYHAYVPMRFDSAAGIIEVQNGGSHIASRQPETITQEMSKKEIRLWKSRRK